jgi:hypothetical protein
MGRMGGWQAGRARLASWQGVEINTNKGVEEGEEREETWQRDQVARGRKKQRTGWVSAPSFSQSSTTPPNVLAGLGVTRIHVHITFPIRAIRARHARIDAAVDNFA